MINVPVVKPRRDEHFDPIADELAGFIAEEFAHVLVDDENAALVIDNRNAIWRGFEERPEVEKNYSRSFHRFVNSHPRLQAKQLLME